MTHTATEHHGTGCSESVSENGQLVVGPSHVTGLKKDPQWCSSKFPTREVVLL
jgi:hypothetical protein